MRQTSPRVLDAPAFVLHTWPWRETSAVVELFAREAGRLPVVAKGARRKTSALRGVLLAFQPLSVSWSGKNELKTLTDAHWQGGQPLLTGVALLCGYYLNELLLRLLPREDGMPQLFDQYAATLQALARGVPHAQLLRRFELALLNALGYGPRLDVVAASGEALQAEATYCVLEEHGVMLWTPAQSHLEPIPGRALLAIAAQDFSHPETQMHAKLLLRHLLQHYLGDAPLESRRILMELQAL